MENHRNIIGASSYNGVSHGIRMCILAYFGPRAVLTGRYSTFEGSTEIKPKCFQRGLWDVLLGVLGGVWVASGVPWEGSWAVLGVSWDV